MNSRKSGRFLQAFGMFLLLFNAYIYLFGDGSPSPALLPIGFMLVVIGAAVIKKSQTNQ